MPPRFRKVLFWIHLTAGLSIALPILVLCITGVLMTYERQMEAWGNWDARSHRPAPGARTLDVEALIREIHQARGVDPQSITVFADSTQPMEVQLDGKPPRALYVDAYSGAVVGEPSLKIRQIFRKVVALHLALGVSGAYHQGFRALVNGVNLVALFLAVLGVFLWIPRRWTWQHVGTVVTLRSGLSGRARDFNWHNAIGIWSTAPLLIIIWTGMAMSYGWARQLTERAVDAANSGWLLGHSAGEGGFVAELGGSENGAREAPLSLHALLTRAKTQMPDWKAIKMVVPNSDFDRVYFTIDLSGDGIRKISALGMDRSGKVVSFVPAGIGGVSSTTLIRYGHTGEAWGVAGQTIAGAASLGGGFLVWTGVALSLRRLRSWLSRKGTATATGADDGPNEVVRV